MENKNTSICETCGQIIIKHTKQQDVIDAVLTYFGLDFHYLKVRGRERRRVYPRQVLMYLLRKNTQLTLDEVGKIFRISDKVLPMDHTTVMNAVHTIENLMFSDPVVMGQIFNLEKMINHEIPII